MNDSMSAARFRARFDGVKRRDGITTPKANRKVLNTRRCEQDGIRFDSRLELFMYNLLRRHGIEFELKPKFTLQEKFRYRDEAVRAITYTTDFYLPDFDLVIDTKGVMTQQGTLRIKLLKRQFYDAGFTTRIELPRTPGECETLVRKLIENQ